MDANPQEQKVRPQARVHFLCARRQLVVSDARAVGGVGPVARCPACGDPTTLPARAEGDPVCRVFQIQCGRAA